MASWMIWDSGFGGHQSYAVGRCGTIGSGVSGVEIASSDAEVRDVWSSLTRAVLAIVIW